MTQIKLIKQEIERLENRCVTAETFAEELLSFIESLEQEPEGVHFTPINRLLNKIPSDKWAGSVNAYAKKLVDCLIHEGYLKDAKVVQNYISYMNGNNVPMAIMDEQEQEVDLDFQHFAKEMDAVFALPESETKNTEENPLNWEYAIANHFFSLGQQSSDNIPKIKGWVARDEDGALYVFASRPQRAKGIYKEDIWDNGDAALPLPKSIFPDLKWEDGPVEVELEIHRV